MVFTIQSTFYEEKNYDICHSNFTDKGDSCDNRCEVDENILSIISFFSYTIIPIFFMIDIIENGIYIKCPDAPLFPVVWFFTIAFICLCIYTILLISICNYSLQRIIIKIYESEIFRNSCCICMCISFIIGDGEGIY